MGCGKGMMLLRLAPQVKVAVGADIIARAVEHVQSVWAGHMATEDLQGSCASFHVSVADAIGFSCLPAAAPSEYHVVLCNGVSMHFPSFKYALTYLNEATDRINACTGGVVMLGDVRTLHHTPLFQLRRLLSAGTDAKSARDSLPEACLNDQQRTYDHRAFYALPQAGLLRGRVGAVELQLKGGGVHSKFSGYRCDVNLHVLPADADTDIHATAQDVVEAGAAPRRGTPEHVADLFEAALAWDGAAPATALAVLGVLNERLYADHLAATGADDAAPYAAAGGVAPAALRACLARRFPGHHAVLGCSRQVAVHRALGMAAAVLPEQYKSVALALMDVYLVPARGSAKLRGLNAVAAHTLAGHAELAAHLANGGLEEYASDQRTTVTRGPKAGAVEQARRCADQGDLHGAVRLLVAEALGLTAAGLAELRASADKQATFEKLGGNSFMGMKLVANHRTLLGTAPPVCTVLSSPLAAFLAAAEADAAAARLDPTSATAGAGSCRRRSRDPAVRWTRARPCFCCSTARGVRPRCLRASSGSCTFAWAPPPAEPRSTCCSCQAATRAHTSPMSRISRSSATASRRR